MNIKESCEQGRIEIGFLSEHLAWTRPTRIHLLKVGDYALVSLPHIKDYVRAEKVEELDSPEKGDFLTVRGTTGPINGNVFIKVNDKNKYPPYMIIEGDRIEDPNCPAPVYDLVNEYLRNRHSPN